MGSFDAKEHYGQVAERVTTSFEACERGSEAFALYAEEVLAGIPEGALAASRGCGDPVAKAVLQPGERVLDLGSGGGIDALIAARLVGDAGHVYGLDMTPQMIELARNNAEAAGIANVEFIEGNIEAVPLPNASVDVVVSNCVINFSDDKPAVLREAARVLRPGGRLVVSDIVAFESIPEAAYADMCELTGCRNGISAVADYERMLAECGFSDSTVELKTLYDDAVLEEKAIRKGRESNLEAIRREGGAGSTGSAIVTAVR